MCVGACASVERQSDTQDAQQRARILRVLQENAAIADGYWVSPRFVEGFKKKWDQSLMGSEPCGEITCEHGALITGRAGKKLIKSEAWAYLRSLYPDGPEYPGLTAECPMCLAYDAAVERREAERKATKKKFQTVYTRPARRKEPDSGPYNLLATTWLNQWREYLDEPRIEEEPPAIGIPIAHYYIRVDIIIIII
jgi:hypothetical protein